MVPLSMLSKSNNTGIDARYLPLAALLEDMTGVPPCEGNSLEIIIDGKRKYELLLQDLENARESISIEYFLFSFDSGARAVLDLLKRKAREGVKVRFTSENLMNAGVRWLYIPALRRAGVEVQSFNTFLQAIFRINRRNHRKILVIDDRIGYTGGMNINNRYFWDWRDTHIRVEGPAAAQMLRVFDDTWRGRRGIAPGGADTAPAPVPPLTSTLQVVADGPHQPSHPILAALDWLLANVRDYIYIQTPYFTPGRHLLDQMEAAVKRGVEVCVMLPRTQQRITDFMLYAGRSYYRECIRRGVRICERIGPFMHSKTIVADDCLSCIGTANIDWRSCRQNYEDNAYIYGQETALENKRIFLEDRAISEEMTADVISRWSIPARLYQSILRLAAPLL